MLEGLRNIIERIYYMPSAFVNNTAINAHDLCSAFSRRGVLQGCTLNGLILTWVLA